MLLSPNDFRVNAIRVGHGVVLINVFRLDPDKAAAFVATQVSEYKRLQGAFPGSLSANLHFSTADASMAMRQSTAFAEHVERLKRLVLEAEPQLSTVAYTQHNAQKKNFTPSSTPF